MSVQMGNNDPVLYCLAFMAMFCVLFFAVKLVIGILPSSGSFDASLQTKLAQ
jgi:hypothetical protein